MAEGGKYISALVALLLLFSTSVATAYSPYPPIPCYVKDVFGNPVSGATVTYEWWQGTTKLVGGSGTTDANGYIEIPYYPANYGDVLKVAATKGSMSGSYTYTYYGTMPSIVTVTITASPSGTLCYVRYMSGNPAPGAIVTAEWWRGGVKQVSTTKTADADGRAEIPYYPAICGDVLKVTATKGTASGSYTYTYQGLMPDNITVTIVATMEGIPCYVQDAYGRPIRGASVHMTAWLSGTKYENTRLTDENGKVEVPVAPFDNVEVWAEYGGERSSVWQVNCYNPPTSITLLLTVKKSVEFRFMDANGSPLVTLTTIELLRNDTVYYKDTRLTDNWGRIDVTCDYGDVIRVKGISGACSFDEQSWVCDNTIRDIIMIVQWSSPIPILCHVVDNYGNAVNCAKVFFEWWRDNRMVSSGSLMTDSYGLASIPYFPIGYGDELRSWAVYGNNAYSSVRTFEFVGTALAQFDLVLEYQNLIVPCYVVDNFGRPAGNVMVHMEWWDGDTRLMTYVRTTNANGYVAVPCHFCEVDRRKLIYFRAWATSGSVRSDIFFDRLVMFYGENFNNIWIVDNIRLTLSHPLKDIACYIRGPDGVPLKYATLYYEWLYGGSVMFSGSAISDADGRADILYYPVRYGGTLRAVATYRDLTSDEYVFVSPINVPDNFTLVVGTDVTGYRVAVDVYPPGSGEVRGAGTYKPGAIVTLTAYSPDHVFLSWTGNIINSSPTITFTMPPRDVHVTAYFSRGELSYYLFRKGFIVLSVENSGGAMTVTYATRMRNIAIDNLFAEAFEVLRLSFFYLHDSGSLGGLNTLSVSAYSLFERERVCTVSANINRMMACRESFRSDAFATEADVTIGPKPRSITPPSDRLIGSEVLVLVSPEYSDSEEIDAAIRDYALAVKEDTGWDVEVVKLTRETNTVGHIRDMIANKYRTDGIFAAMLVGDDIAVPIEARYHNAEAPNLRFYSSFSFYGTVFVNSNGRTFRVLVSSSSSQRLIDSVVTETSLCAAYETPPIQVLTTLVVPKFLGLSHREKVSYIASAFQKFSVNRNEDYGENIYLRVAAVLHFGLKERSFEEDLIDFVGRYRWLSSSISYVLTGEYGERDNDVALFGRSFKLVGSFGHGTPGVANKLYADEVLKINTPFLVIDGCYTEGWFTENTTTGARWGTQHGWFGGLIFTHPTLRVVFASANVPSYALMTLGCGGTVAESLFGVSYEFVVYGDPTFHYSRSPARFLGRLLTYVTKPFR